MNDLSISNSFQILYSDEHFVAINKPHDYLVHRSPIARNAKLIVLQKLRDQINQKVYPIHRLDRKTSGVLIFGLSSNAHRRLGNMFANQEVKKNYMAIVRGWTEKEGLIDYALTNDRGKTQSAITEYQTLKHFEIQVALGKFETSRYSLVDLFPKTGRMHQLRKHMAHIFHPIVGDRPHGCNKQNRMWKSKFEMNTMMLHAKTLSFIHPFSEKEVTIEAPLFAEFERVLTILEP